MREPYEPRQRVILFAANEVSGATVGRAAVIVCPLFHFAGAVNWNAWVYRVYDLVAERFLDASSESLIAADGFQPLEEPPHPARTVLAARLLFETEPLADQDSLSGLYQLPSGEWERFTFVKTDDVAENFRLSAPVRAEQMRAGVLRYSVPRTMTLDASFVREAIQRIRSVELWSS